MIHLLQILTEKCYNCKTMLEKDILTSLFIRNGAKSLERALEAAFNKKKHRKPLMNKEESLEEYSFFNLV